MRRSERGKPCHRGVKVPELRELLRIVLHPKIAEVENKIVFQVNLQSGKSPQQMSSSIEFFFFHSLTCSISLRNLVMISILVH